MLLETIRNQIDDRIHTKYEEPRKKYHDVYGGIDVNLKLAFD